MVLEEILVQQVSGLAGAQWAICQRAKPGTLIRSRRLMSELFQFLETLRRRGN